MFSSSRRLNILSSLLVVLAAGCGGGGLGCNGCASEPLPGGALPADQTVEGGGQIRVSPAGFTKISGLIESVVGDQLDGAGVCIPEQNFGSDFLGADLCNGNQGGCTPGCEVDINLDSVDVMPAGNALNVRAQLDVSASDNVNYTISFIPGTCTLSFNANDLVFDADIDLGIEPASGELTVDVGQINDLQFNVNSSGCVIGDIAGFIFDFLDFFDDLFGPVFANLLTPTINDLLDGMLPDPLGVEGMTDVGALVAGVSPGTEGNLETRLVPGGYVTLNNGGMSLGLITGFNADEDITTRTGDLDNEPAYCVPPFEAPDFAAAPHNLPVQPLRQTFMLPAADEFNGNPNPATDVAMGISETTLDLLGHHGVTSGAMCLGIGTTTVAQLNLGTIGLLVPSLLEQQSDQGSDPMLLVTRPQRALDFSIGEGTEESPSITIRIEDLEVDFYAFLYERYTRAFTMSLTLDAGINLEINQNPGEAATITPILVGLSSDNIGIEVLNSEFVRETPENLEAVLPTVFDLVLPLLAEGLPPIAVPEFAGFRMSDLTVARVQTDEDDFLAINASLNESPAMLAALAAHAGPRTEAYLADLQASSDAVPAAHLISQPIATLRAVATPAPDAIRAGLQVGDEAQLPTVAINAASADADGRALEWSWRLAGGLWRPFARPEGDVLTIRDRAFVWQGKHDLELRARLVDAPQTSVSGVSPVTAIIDSVEPVVEVEAAAWDSAGAFAVPAHDAVSGTTLTWAYGAPGADAPATAWASTPAAPRATIEGLTIDGEVAVFVRDEAGNETTALAKVAGFHGQADAAGCGGCQSQTGSGGALLVLITGTLLALGGRRGRARGLLAQAWRARTQVGGAALLWLGASAAASLVPGCNCGNDPSGESCEVPEDCIELCEGQIPFCIDNLCECSNDVPTGRLGPYSDVAVGGDQIWVSAYADTWGDLVVANPDEAGRILPNQWEWVDGVPDVEPQIMGAEVRGGITVEGEDVGMYTSIAVTNTGEPRVSYFDRENGALKYAAKVDGAWQLHVVDEGDGGVKGTAEAGVYTAISLRTDDGRPGIAYTTYVTEGAQVTAQVWFAAAQTANPTAAADWTLFPVDSAVLPPEDEANPDPYPLPGGLGLFVDVARGPDQAPVVVYYDRTAGDLKMSRLDPGTGVFTPPQVIDGIDGDAGWSPTVTVGPDNTVHIAYVAATHDDLQYWNSATGTVEIIDDGYRIVGTTEDGLPKPEYHFVGDDVTINLLGSQPVVVYQDATSHELMESRRGADGLWSRETLAGNEQAFAGAYGFFASSALSPNQLVISTWVLDLPAEDQWVEIFLRNVNPD